MSALNVLLEILQHLYKKTYTRLFEKGKIKPELFYEKGRNTWGRETKKMGGFPGRFPQFIP